MTRTLIYPLLGARLDCGFMRLAGHGLGNAFYTYFHAAVLADRSGGLLIAPPWFSLKMGPLLRGSRSKRLYWRMFKPLRGDLWGGAKLMALSLRRDRVMLTVGATAPPTVVPGALNLVESGRFTFTGLHEHRALIRRRLLGIVNDPLPQGHQWGRGAYVAVHVRLGDFAQTMGSERLLRGEPNLRIPLSWYGAVLESLQRRLDLPVLVFSDGDEAQLAPLLRERVRLYRSGSDITDLLVMSGARLLVGSNSTYSRWAAFLGDMPSIWLRTAMSEEQPSGPDTPILYLPLDGQPDQDPGFSRLLEPAVTLQDSEVA